MPQDPGTIFGGLLKGCISDRYHTMDRKALAEGAIFLILGAVSSVVTTYALTLVRFLL